MSNNQYNLTIEDAILCYESGGMTAKGLLYFYFKIRGDKPRQSCKEICRRLGIQKSAFYRGIAQLQIEGMDLLRNREIRY